LVQAATFLSIIYWRKDIQIVVERNKDPISGNEVVSGRGRLNRWKTYLVLNKRAIWVLYVGGYLRGLKMIAILSF